MPGMHHDPPLPDPAPDATAERWHLWGAAVPDAGVDAAGNPVPSWVQMLVDRSTLTVEQVSGSDVVIVLADDVEPVRLPYVTSWDHAPTRDELDAAKPTQFRDDPNPLTCHAPASR